MGIARILMGAFAAVTLAAVAVWFLAPPAPITPEREDVQAADPSPPASEAVAERDIAATVSQPQPAPAAQATPEPAAAAKAPAPAEAEPQPADVAQAPAPAEPEPAAAPANPPSLDVARIETDGSALFAGRATPGERVEIRIGETVAATAEAGPDGAFVAFGAAPGGGASQVELRVADGPAAEDEPIFLAAPEVADAPDAPPTVVLQTTREGVALLQAPPRAPEQMITLDILSYAESGEVEVGGRGEPLRRLRIWADATMIAETSVRDDGQWSARAAAALAPGVYTLRVDALNAEGGTAFSVSSPFRREPPDRLALAEGDVVIQPGDTLWRIAENLYGQGVRYTLIFDANRERIRDPDLIYPGQVFNIPEPAAN